jgi:uncharacterized CHY-type Zn-finger protein
LISKEYNANKTLLDITCGLCKQDYKQVLDRFKKGYQHQGCPKKNKNTPVRGYRKQVTLKPIICGICNKEFQPVRSNAKLCSSECAKTLMRTDEYKKRAFFNGQKGGKVSATSQSRRSKNEIYFSELCAKEFDITTNEPYFEGWDADVIIHSEKTAILWNGIWHYKQIMKSQSLKQVQARDKVKTAIIEKFGYTPYVIKDMGKYDKAFVEQEFEIFKLMRMEI